MLIRIIENPDVYINIVILNLITFSVMLFMNCSVMYYTIYIIWIMYCSDALESVLGEWNQIHNNHKFKKENITLVIFCLFCMHELVCVYYYFIDFQVKLERCCEKNLTRFIIFKLVGQSLNLGTSLFFWEDFILFFFIWTVFFYNCNFSF